ncbi:hypothetical protein [Brachyspira alvinipulli]|uniref:hypothetical protein n=1 Tax=Brachyspira alvinipulli TaxID=84379 RepID=UPI00048308DC|nr:hypothetical protein [Brachyspira alvinipulli]
MLSKNKILLRQKIKSVLKNMLPFNELDFNIHFDRDYKQLKYIDLYMCNEYIRIKKGTKLENISDKNNKIRKCLKDIYKEFEEEIQNLFDRSYYDFEE